MTHPGTSGAVVLRDVTLREGLDTPGVTLALEARVEIASALAAAGLDELEVVAPSRVRAELEVARAIRDADIEVRLTGLVYAAPEGAAQELAEALEVLDHVELLMPLSEARPPVDVEQKLVRTLEVLSGAFVAPDRLGTVGVGLPHSTQVEASRVVEFAQAAAATGAARVTLYDTNGSADPFRVGELVAAVTARVSVPVFFHAHQDLGLAAANAFAAVRAGARGLDVTVNGLGDRAGNTPLEQIATLLSLRGARVGAKLGSLRELSRLVERHTGVPVSKLAPIVGELVFTHRSPGHLGALGEFEAIEPSRVGAVRAVDRTPAAPDRART